MTACNRYVATVCHQAATDPAAGGALFCLALSACDLAWQRALRMGDASVDDYLEFPAREIAASGKVRAFARQADPSVTAALRGETIVYEAYGDGMAEDSVVTSFSVAKSIVSAMVGKALETGLINSLDDPVTAYLPELAERDPRFGGISLRNLLTMSSGLAYRPFPDARADDIETYYNPDLRAAARERTVVDEAAGTHFLYNNYNPLLMGMVLEKATGGTVSAWLEEQLWRPMGAEYPASWSLDSVESGFEKMESGLNARAVDFLRFGCLFRDKGSVAGVQVLPAAWVAESTAELVDRSTAEYYRDAFGFKVFHAGEGGYYSHHWYGLRRAGATRDDFFAAGNKSQIVYVSPDSGMVMVRFGSRDGIDFWKWIQLFSSLARR